MKEIEVKSIDILMAEHRIISGNLNEMEKLLSGLTVEGLLMLSPYLEFLQSYADEHHHAKEEKLLYPWMIKHRPELHNGPVGFMFKEHAQGRSLVTSVTQVVENVSLQMEGVQEAKENLEFFFLLYRQHMSKEDDIIYKIALQIDSKTHDGDQCLLLEFAKLEQELGLKKCLG